jgi:hypothetical protein
MDLGNRTDQSGCLVFGRKPRARRKSLPPTPGGFGVFAWRSRRLQVVRLALQFQMRPKDSELVADGGANVNRSDMLEDSPLLFLHNWRLKC